MKALSLKVGLHTNRHNNTEQTVFFPHFSVQLINVEDFEYVVDINDIATRSVSKHLKISIH